MKRLLSSALGIMMSLMVAHAHMTDSQIVDYVKTQASAGMDQTEIAKQLLAKGVTPDQLQRIKSQYQSSASGSSTTTKRSSISRLRQYNGEERAITKDDTEHATPQDTLFPYVEDPGMRIFGHDIFQSEKLTFQPNMNIPAPATYLIGPGDEVIIDIYGSSQNSVQLEVAPDGSITIPEEGPVNVAGLTQEQAQARVRSAIGSHYEGSDLKLSIGQTRTVQVHVMGEVMTPGTYTLSAFSSVFNALYLAGGINEIGTMRNVRVSRNGKTVTTVDVYDFILNGNLPGNITLQDEDVVIVGAYENLVRIEGNVKRPMYYEMKENETLRQLITYAGGFAGDAYRDRIRVERKSSEGLTVHNVSAKEMSAFHHYDGDVVVVQSVIERYRNTVQVSGAVFRPGSYRLDSHANSVRTLIEQAGGLLEQAVTTRAVLIRIKEDRTYQTETVALSKILDGSQPDIVLRNEDELIISSYEKLASDRKMYVWGEVMNPGSFTYSENTTIGDLITMAGGLKETATLEKVEVSRRITTATDNADGNQMAKVYTFDLDPSLNIIGNTEFRLEPYDQITIHSNPNYKTQRSVYIGGEVQYEGYYTLTSKDERLSSLVQRAGGLTGKAYVSGAKLSRRYTDNEMKDRVHLLEIAGTRKDSIAASRALEKTTYSVGINLAKALKDANGAFDVILIAGDSVIVPQMSNVVKVSGEVLSPNTITYLSGKGTNYYINQAGGVTDSGRRRKAYILYANGQISTRNKGKVEPGCEIVVPSKREKKIDTAKVSMWATLASATSTVGAVIATILK